MATDYPDAVDSLPRPTAATAMNASGFEGDVVIDNISDAIEAVQTELGTNPAGAFATVVARLEAAESRLSSLEGSGGPLPTPTTMYGTGTAGDGVGNLRIGYVSTPLEMSYRFVADNTETLDGIRCVVKCDGTSAYRLGTGGTIRVTVRPDDAGRPNMGTSLAYLDMVEPDFASGDTHRLWTFSSPASLTSGTTYHLTFQNIDASPTANYTSINSLVWLYGTKPTPRQPKYPEDDWAVLWRLDNGSNLFEVDSTYTPILQLNWGDSTYSGQGYHGASTQSSSEKTPVIAGTTHMVRERITVTGGDKSVSNVGVRVARYSGSGNLLVRLEDSSNTLIDSCSIPISTLVQQDPAALPIKGGFWVTGAFSQAQTLTNGSTYYLRLSTDTSTSLYCVAMQQGTAVGYDASTSFGDGYFQYTTDGSTWANHPNLGTVGDLPFYLVTA